MSFICQNCLEAQKDGTTPTLVTSKSRDKTYPKRYDGEGKLVDKGGSGLEIVEEIRLCSQCANNF